MQDIGQLMRQAQAMQAKIVDAQKRVEEADFVGMAGAGLVKVTLNGKGVLGHIEIDASLAGDLDIVADLVKAAHEDARKKAEDFQTEQMKGVTGGLGMLPGFKLPF